MNGRLGKLISLADAAALVQDGDTVVLGGCFTQNKPMAVVRELVRQGRRHLDLVAPPTGSIDVDLLAGAGVVRKVVSSYVGFEHLGLAPHFRTRVEQGELELWECDEAHLQAALEAAARAAPAGLTRSGLGTDLPRLNPDLKVIADPFTGEPVVAVRALGARIAFLHVQIADPYGNARHLGSIFADLLIAQAVKRQGGTVVITADQVVPPEARSGPRWTTLPHTLVDHVVEAPYGAHPCASHGLYSADEEHFRAYLAASREPQSWQAYLERYVMKPAEPGAYLDCCGGAARLLALGRGVHHG